MSFNAISNNITNSTPITPPHVSKVGNKSIPSPVPNKSIIIIDEDNENTLLPAVTALPLPTLQPDRIMELLRHNTTH